MACLILGVGEEIIAEPTDFWSLVKTILGGQQLHAMENTSILVLPTATSGKKLLKYKRAVTYLIFAPCQATEVADRAQYRSGQD